MDAIEKRALHLLCGEIDLDPEDYDEGERIEAGEALRAVIAALTPPEGYVLVDAKKLGAVRVARLAILQKQAEAEQKDEPHDASMWAECAADLDAIAPRGMIAARPEVKP